ncbi:MAG: hypothetical protein CL693_19155 [Cellvibrionaceae bacterium]|nr:hypothetical protein [Cellvibrionaceae bacterium]|tara:strand:+ start:73405 stop:74475 length:1071 start_codon:yes stop_codon:yes gene_type:complete
MPTPASLTKLFAPAVSLLLAAATLGTTALAQVDSNSAQEQPEADRWYQVEVILFAHKQTASDEILRNDIALAYPPNWIQLKDPEALVEACEAAAQAEQSSTTTDSARDISALEPTDNTAETTAETHDSLCPQMADSEDRDEAMRQLVDLEREAYYLLPKAMRALNEQAQELKWSRAHRVLFHEAWRQPILNSDRATSILVSAGESYGQHKELEGTFSISVSRYLHLRTNLWFTQFAHNYGQDKGLWPDLPTSPEQLDYSITKIEEDITSPWDKIEPLNDEYDKILARPFVPERIALIKQKRRMRSKEIHYVDHPNVGIILLIEPYEVPVEEDHTEEPNAELAPFDTQPTETSSSNN